MPLLDRFQDRVIRVLRWSEKYTKTDMVYLARGGFWSIFGQISASVIALGLAIIMARFVPKDAYGSYKYALAIVSILATFSLSGIGAAVFQSVAHGYRSAIDDGFKANLQWSAFVFIGGLFGGAYYLYHGNLTFGLGILIGGCVTPFISGYNLYLSLLTGEKDFKAAAWYGDFVTNILPALALALIAYFSPQPLSLIGVYFFANAAAAAYAYYRARQHYPDVTHEHDPGMITYGKHLSLMNILAGIAGNVDQVLLFHFVGPVELAIYNFAIAIPDQSKGPLKNLDAMVQARYAARDDMNIRASMNSKLVRMFVFYAVMTALYILAAPLMYRLLFPAYVDAALYSQIYSLSMLVFPLSVAASYLAVRKKVREQYVVAVGSSLFQIAAMTVGILGWGLLGLIVARVVSRSFQGVVAYVMYILG